MLVLITFVSALKLFKLFLCFKQFPLGNFNLILKSMQIKCVFNVLFMYFKEKTNFLCLIRVFKNKINNKIIKIISFFLLFKKLLLYF